MPYYYFKAQSIGESPLKTFFKKAKKRFIRLAPNILIVVGATAVTTVSYPMLSYKAVNKKWQSQQITSPVNNDKVDEIKGIAQNPNQIKFQDPATPVVAFEEPEVVSGIDYTKAENWFVGSEFSNQESKKYAKTTTYSISIPKLNIKDMEVEVGGNNLDRHLIHYPGTALPGQYGNPVIFGHSVLPIFYNPKNYMAVFSKLPTLEKDNEIYIDYDGIKYRYVVESYHEVEPDKVDVLEQRYDRQTITLITCVPPGTYLRRGIIMAVLEKL
jgi:sortase A